MREGGLPATPNILGGSVFGIKGVPCRGDPKSKKEPLHSLPPSPAAFLLLIYFFSIHMLLNVFDKRT